MPLNPITFRPRGHTNLKTFLSISTADDMDNFCSIRSFLFDSGLAKTNLFALAYLFSEGSILLENLMLLQISGIIYARWLCM